MNVKRFVCCLLASVLLLGVSLISCGNSSRAKAKNEIAQSGEDFKSFLPVTSPVEYDCNISLIINTLQ